MKTIAVIPAGGSGRRSGESLPKQYHLINGQELIAYTINVFERSGLIDEIIIAAQPEYFELLGAICKRNGFSKVKSIIAGGRERQDSVLNALQSVRAPEEDLIVVHDAARPLLSQEILASAIETAKVCDSVLVAIPARDTLVQGGEFVEDYLERSGVFYAQTPQVFRCGILRKSFQAAYEQGFYGTDESMLVKRAGYKVKIVTGSSLNFKVTVKEDIELCKILCKFIL